MSPSTKVTRTASWGAKVVLHGDTLAEAAAHAQELAARDGLVFIRSYQSGQENPGHGPGRRGTFGERLVNLASADQQRQSSQQLAHADGGTVKIEQTFEKDSQRNHTAEQDDPHEGAAFLEDF